MLNLNTRMRMTFPAILGVCLLAWPLSHAEAYPVQAQFTDAPHCDTVPATTLTHELGTGNAFPIDEQIAAGALLTSKVICVPDDGIANDYEVRITNLSPIAWQDLFFVVDEGSVVGNYDGVMNNLAFGIGTAAFRIDGTLTVTGNNDNLLLESGGIPNNEIFEPGESWTFLVSNFVDPAGIGPVFDSVGFGVGSPGFPPSTASILANPVPEPGTLVLLTLGALAMRRRIRG
jgi:hypothetical protein